ncbi:MAG: 4Fe-4S binding protein [Candidatus Omnitrophica bacterium]|nr:4Fe-4S binding protein [Candidatus Omnitrophota bacterium]
MGKVIVDASLCVGCGLCEQACPEVFKIESDGVAHVIKEDCTGCNVADVASQCPVEAIKIK